MSHTPGPWRVKEGLDRDTGEIATYVYGGLTIIAECYGQDSIDNARLIVAAPDLLDVVQHILRCIPIDGFAQIHHGSSTWARLDAVATKATGGKV